MGVTRSGEEIEGLKLKILDYLSQGYGRTFYGACQNCQVGTSEAYKWRKEDEGFEKGVTEARHIGMENAMDVAENGSMKLLMGEDGKHIRWFLETKGKGRGYVKRVEQTGKDGSSLHPMSEPVPKATEEEGLAAINEMVRRT